MPFLDDGGVTRLVQDLLPYFSNRDALDDVFANFATIETSSTASKAYSINDLLVKDDILYRVTSNIASGATITVGTNVVALQIEDIYDLVNTKLNISDYRRQLTWGELEDAITWGDLEGDTGDTGTTTYTEDYHLAKPSLLNQASIVPINNNMDLIDAALADKLDDADYRKAMTWGEVGDKYNWGVLGTSSQTTGTTYTDTLGLEKPGNNSTVDVDVLNDNYDTIDDAIENTQESMAMIESHTAQSNHAIGSYFMLDNVLHKATSTIASGETITSGTNAIPITLEQALTALNTSIQSVQNSLSNLVTKSFTQTIWTTKTSMSYTGVSVTVPANKPFIIFVQHDYENTIPRGVVLSTRNDMWDGISTPYEGHASITTLSGYNTVSRTYYVWAQAGAANLTNVIRVGLAYLNI